MGDNTGRRAQRMEHMKQDHVTIYRAAAIRDAQGANARPGAVAVKHGRVVASGHPDSMSKRLLKNATIIDRPHELIFPALVNAHAHLDLTSLGPTPYGGDFTAWLRDVVSRRPTDPKLIIDAVRRGLVLSREAGVGHLGDIAGSTAAVMGRRQTPHEAEIPGVSYIECFGVGEHQASSIAQVTRALNDLPFETRIDFHDRGAVLGVGPHAPYSTGMDVYMAANRLSHDRIYRLSTHLAETLEEIQFVRDAEGPFAELLKELGKWDDSITPTGQHPVQWLEPMLKHARWVLAHCNYVEDEHIDILQKTGTSVAYCPVASEYFGHVDHRYRDMLEAGVNVCLGTDSILCQPADEPQPMGILAQMRCLYRRDQTDPGTLLKMATTHGMLALEYSETDATLQKRAPAVFAAVKIDPNDPLDPLVQVLMNDQLVTPIDATRDE
jgi:cytosine/adenosine deaminase-related metal-dependent hydrolase